jgi:hypothetical protein
MSSGTSAAKARDIEMLRLLKSKVYLRVLKRPVPTANGIRLTLKTDQGPRELNCSRHIRIYRYKEAGMPVTEAEVPEWLALKAGLIQ